MNVSASSSPVFSKMEADDAKILVGVSIMGAEDANTLVESEYMIENAKDCDINNVCSDKVAIFEGFGYDNGGNIDEGQNGDFRCSVDDEVAMQSQVNETRAAIDNIFGPLDVGVFCKDDENGGFFDEMGTFDSEDVTRACEDEVIVGSGFSEKSLDIMELGVSPVEIPNDKNLGECDEVEAKNVENVDDSEIVYSVGDFVWSKFNSHPWWPAQIYDPSDASDHAKKFKLNSKPFLVAYFGDGSFSWRSPSQLKPFAENFNELSKQNNSPIFTTSVESAVDEIGRVMELKMACNCISDEIKAGLVRAGVVNIGIKEGVTGPKCDLSRLPVSESSKLVLNLEKIAAGNWGQSMLEMTALRSHLSALYRARGGRNLVFYQEGLMIDGMEDKDMYMLGNVADGSDLQKYAKRKRKSVAKPMKESANSIADNTKKIKSIGKFCVSLVKKVPSFENGSDEDERKALDEKAGSVLVEETEEMRTSRKRKKSRYLSYPYTNTLKSVKGSKWDLVEEPMKIDKIEFNGKTDNTSALSGSGSELEDDDQKKMVGADQVKASPVEVIATARSAAINPVCVLGLDSSDMVNDFIYAYKSVVYTKGSCFKSFGKKGKSSKPKTGASEPKETNDDEMITLSELKSDQKKKTTKDAVTNKEGLLWIKQKLEKVNQMVKNCDVDAFPEVKISLGNDMKDILEKINAMSETQNSS